MPLSDVDKPAIDATLAEFDQLGRKDFLEKYGFGTATTYLLRVNGRFYDPKAVVGVAHQHTPAGTPLTSDDFEVAQAVGRLDKLEYELVPFSGLWWVNQGDTYKIERDNGFIWAPQKTKAGFGVTHHTNVRNLRVGQRIVHYADNNIRAIGTVAEAPVEAPQPDVLNNESWQQEGYLCPVDYYVLPNPISRTDIPERSAEVGPFDVNGNVKQGYLYRISDEYLFPLLEFLNRKVPDFFASPVAHPHLKTAPDVTSGSSASADPILENLLAFKNVVLEGVPGTGKTYAIERVADQWKARTGRDLLKFGDRPFRAIVLHPSSSYEDFVEGLRPSSGQETARELLFDEHTESDGVFGLEDGFFVSICAAAAAAPDKDVLVLLDELNRCNVPSVFGDLLLTLEPSRRGKYTGAGARSTPNARDWTAPTPARLTYSGRTFFVPDNVYVVATTNTTDRSVAPLDAALRRRFAFHRLEPTMPDDDVLGAAPETVRELFTRSSGVLRDLNEHVLRPCLGPDAMLGHSYLYALAEPLRRTIGIEAGLNEVKLRWQYAILPQLIDAVRSLGAENLLAPDVRTSWFDEHAELARAREGAKNALRQFDEFLQQTLALEIVVEGTGLARGARVTHRSPSAEETSISEVQDDDADTEPDLP